MQGGRLLVDTKLSAEAARRPGAVHVRADRARRRFDRHRRAAAHRTGLGTARRRVVRVDRDDAHARSRSTSSDRRRRRSPPTELAALFEANSMRVHGFLRDQRMVAGVGRRLANEVCHTREDLAVRQHPQARRRRAASSSCDALAAVHRGGSRVRADPHRHEFVEGSAERGARARPAKPCPVCGDTIRAVVVLRATPSTTARPARPTARSSPTTRPLVSYGE